MRDWNYGSDSGATVKSRSQATRATVVFDAHRRLSPTARSTQMSLHHYELRRRIRLMLTSDNSS
ncbi:MAG: hypothetical protein ABIT20_08170 [Gemmatimonadaceae bacterium]